MSDKTKNIPNNDELYNETEFYMAEINPLVNEIKRKCEEKKLPFVFYLEHQNTETHTVAANVVLIPDGRTSPRALSLSAMTDCSDHAFIKFAILAKAIADLEELSKQ